MEDPRSAARTMVQHNIATLDELWLRYFANGGEAEPFDFDAYVHGLQHRDELDLTILTWAIEDIKEK